MFIMEVACPNCYAAYPVSLDMIPQEGLGATCERCETVFTIVRSSGDPVKDRAQRMKGFVVLRDERTEDLFRETEGASKKASARAYATTTIFENKSFKLGVCLAGILLLLSAALFFVWRNQVQSHFEKALKNSLAYASNRRFALTFDDVKFSFFGGLAHYRGCIYGLSVTDLETGGSLKLVDRIPFDLDSSRKHFITEPFNMEVKTGESKTAFRGCVLEAEQTNEAHLKLKIEEAYSIASGVELFTVRGMEGSLDFSTAGRPEGNEPFLEGDADLGLQARQIEAWNETLGQDVDIFISIKNGLFTKDRQAGELGTVRYTDLFRSKWGENKAVAALERCSLNLLGSAVKLAGKVEFHNPVEQSEANLHLSVKDFRHIMKFIYRTNEKAFDKIVAMLVALEENKSPVYEQDSDSLDLRISYKNSKIKLNDHEIQGLIM
jgi:predicted Zn finger-like uncharacterized protein